MLSKCNLTLLFFFIASFNLAAGSEKSLTLKSSEIRSAKGKVYFEPNRNRRKASYTTYVFDGQEFASKVGKFKGKKEIKIKIIKTRKEKSNLDPRMPQPIGGFTYTYHDSVIIGSAKKGRSEINDQSKKEDLTDCFNDNDEGRKKIGSKRLKKWCLCMYDKWPNDSTFETITQWEENSPEGSKADTECSALVNW